MFNKNLQNNKGFTLVEMMVSVAIFSIVVMIALGAILTILDANRKSRTLTEVMNNLNFSVEMITRSLKTGVEPGYEDGILHVGSIVLSEAGFERERTRYKCEGVDGGDCEEEGVIGRIMQCIDDNFLELECNSNQWSPITSELVDIDSFVISVVPNSVGNRVDFVQPRIQIVISGTAKVNESISSGFSLQTSVSQRRLNIAGSELD